MQAFLYQQDFIWAFDCQSLLQNYPELKTLAQGGCF